MGLEECGRSAEVYSLEGPRVVRLAEVKDLEESGELSIFSGDEILNFYLTQLPLNPYVFSNLKKLDIKHEQTYVIAESRRVFQLVLHSVSQARVYHDHRGRSFNGSKFPDVYVLETELSPGVLRSRPVSRVDFTGVVGPQTGEPYLFLNNQHELELFISGPRPKRRLGVILPAGESNFPERFLDLLTGVWQLGENVKVVGPEQALVGAQKYFTRADVSAWKRSGHFKMFRPEAYSIALLLLGLAVSVVGLYHGPGTTHWYLAGILFVGLSGFYWTHKALTGLLAVAILKLGWRRKNRSLIWYLLAGFLTYGLIYTSYRLSPLALNEYFWSGFITGGIFFLSPPLNWLKRAVLVEDLVYLLGLAVLSALVVQAGVVPRPAVAALLVAAPLFGWIFPRRGVKRSLIKLLGTIGWLYLFVQGAGMFYLFVFAATMVFWQIEQLYLDVELPENYL